MKHLFLSFSLLIGMTSLSAQQNLANNEQRKVAAKAQEKLMQLQDLLNFISNESEVHDDVVQAIEVVFSDPQSPHRLFFERSSTIESDIDPTRFDHTQIVDLNAYGYLKEVDLMYDKTIDPTIRFSNFQVSKIYRKDYFYVLIRFDSHFNGSHRSLPLPYRTTQRVAEFRVVKEGKQYVPYLSGIRFFSPNMDFKAKDYRAKEGSSTPNKGTPLFKEKKWPLVVGGSLVGVGGGILAIWLRPQPKPNTSIE